MQKRCNNVIAIFSDREDKFCKSNIDAFFLYGPQLRDAEVITSCSCRLITILHKLLDNECFDNAILYHIHTRSSLSPHFSKFR